jgi:Ran GTPase-activating protein (RanGAP) involved in mRNA processing and transport
VSDYLHRNIVDGRVRYCPPKEELNPLREASYLARDLAAASMPQLTKLELSDMAIGDEGLGVLVAAPTFAALEWLRLSDVAMGDEGARHLADGPWRESLRELFLSHATLGDDGARELARAPWAKELRRLSLASDDLGSAGVAALHRCAALKHLSLGGRQIGDEAAVAIASAKHPHLERLDLSRTAVGARGAAALARAQRCFPALKYLSLQDCPLGEEGKARLTQSPWLRHAGNQSYRTRAGEQAAAFDRKIMDIAFPKK